MIPLNNYAHKNSIIARLNELGQLVERQRLTITGQGLSITTTPRGTTISQKIEPDYRFKKGAITEGLDVDGQFTGQFYDELGETIDKDITVQCDLADKSLVEIDQDFIACEWNGSWYCLALFDVYKSSEDYSSDEYSSTEKVSSGWLSTGDISSDDLLSTDDRSSNELDSSNAKGSTGELDSSDALVSSGWLSTGDISSEDWSSDQAFSSGFLSTDDVSSDELDSSGQLLSSADLVSSDAKQSSGELDSSDDRASSDELESSGAKQSSDELDSSRGLPSSDALHSSDALASSDAKTSTGEPDSSDVPSSDALSSGETPSSDALSSDDLSSGETPSSDDLSSGETPSSDALSSDDLSSDASSNVPIWDSSDGDDCDDCVELLPNSITFKVIRIPGPPYEFTQTITRVGSTFKWIADDPVPPGTTLFSSINFCQNRDGDIGMWLAAGVGATSFYDTGGRCVFPGSYIDGSGNSFAWY